MVDIYNNLPQAVVELSSVSSFQGRLTEMARERCKRNAAEWNLSFCRRGGPDCGGPNVHGQADAEEDLPELD